MHYLGGPEWVVLNGTLEYGILVSWDSIGIMISAYCWLQRMPATPCDDHCLIATCSFCVNHVGTPRYVVGSIENSREGTRLL